MEWNHPDSYGLLVLPVIVLPYIRPRLYLQGQPIDAGYPDFHAVRNGRAAAGIPALATDPHMAKELVMLRLEIVQRQAMFMDNLLAAADRVPAPQRSEEHTSELQSRPHL